MKQNPYSRFNNESLILRDELALDRTILANERTLLAYLRSAVALLIAGVSIMQFSQQQWFWIIGVICLPVGFFTGLIGVVRFSRMKNAIAQVRNGINTILPPEDFVKTSRPHFNTFDEYIATFPVELQKILQALRQTIHNAAPQAAEKISYQMPTFYLHGNLVHFAAYKHHIGFYPAPAGIEAFTKELVLL